MSNKTNNVFISHIHEDDQKLSSLKNLLKENGREVRDSSIDSSSPNRAQDENYIKQEILLPGIKWSGALMVLISPGTHESKWVNWEIECAHRLGKRIIGVWDHGAKDCDIPDQLDKLADAVVGWNAQRIIDAIDGKINDWQKADGSCPSDRAIEHYNC